MIKSPPLLSETKAWISQLGADRPSLESINNVNRSVLASKAVNQFGHILYDDFKRSSIGANYTQNGTNIAWSISGNKLILEDQTGNSGFNDYVRYNVASTTLENWTMETIFTVAATVDADSYGISLGTVSTGFVNYYINGLFNCTNTVNGGKLVLYRNGASLAVSAGSLAFSVGDRIQLTLTKNINALTLTAFNINTGLSNTLSFTVSSTLTIHSCGNFAIYGHGGRQEVELFKVTSQASINSKVCVIGDSITEGLVSTVIANRWINKLFLGSSSVYTVTALGGNRTQDINSAIYEVQRIRPTYYLINIGGNNLRNAQSLATLQANYTLMINNLRPYCIGIIHCLAIPDDDYDMTAYNAWLTSTYGGTDTIVDTFTSLKTAGQTTLAAAYDGDGTHLNDAGHNHVAGLIAAACPYIL